MTDSLSISELLVLCQEEIKHYQQTCQPSQEKYRVELFRRAWVEQNKTAWAAIYKQYRPLVTRWVHRYSRFSQTGEEAAVFVNEAFTRMMQVSIKDEKVDNFESLNQYLQYLKLCVGSAIEGYLRRKQKDALTAAVTLDSLDQFKSHTDIQEEHAHLDELGQTLAEIIQDEREHLVVEESWVYGLAPRHIYTTYPEIFTAVAEVSQIKRNIIKRLKRKLEKGTDVN